MTYNTDVENKYSLLTWGDSFNASKRVPMIAKRVWKTYADALAWVKDESTDSTATEGLILSVTGDTTDKNGLYQISAIGANGALIRQATKAELDAQGAAATTSIVEGNGVNVASETLANGSTQYTVTADLDIKYIAPVAAHGTVGEEDYVAAVPASIKLVDKTDNTKVFGSVAVSDIIGNGLLKSTAYDKETGILSLTFAKADGGEKVEEINLVDMLDINDMSIAAGSQKYLEVNLEGGENSQAIFSTKMKAVTDATSGATGLADAYDVKSYVDNAIDGLDVTATTVSATNVSFNYSETNGIVTIGSLSVEYTTVSKTASTSSAGAPKTDAAISVTNEAKLATGADIKAVAEYAADKAMEEMHRVDAKIAALAGDVESDDAAAVKVEVKTVAGQVNDVIVTTLSAGVNREGDAKDARALTATTATGAVIGGDIASIKGYVDDKVADATSNLAVSATGDSYVSAAVDGTDNKKINVTTNTKNVTVSAGTRGTWTVTAAGVATLADETAPSIAGETGKLLDSADAISAVKTYTDAVVAVEAAERAAKIEAAIKALDVEETGVSEAKGNITFDYAQTDGKVSIGGLAVAYTTVATGATSSTVEAPNTDASISVTNGSQLAIGSDIEKVAAYAAAKVQEEADARTKAINDLDFNNVGSATAGSRKVVNTVSQTDGKISATTIDLKAANIDATAIEAGDNTVAVTGADVASQIQSIAQTVKSVEKAAKAAHNVVNTKTDGHVTVAASTNASTGQITYTVSENDIASAALVGNSGDASTAATVFGAIKAEEEARVAAIQALDKTEITTAGQYIVGVSETDGVISARTKQVEATEVSYVKNGDKVITGATTVSAALKELDAELDASTKAQKQFRHVALTTEEITALNESNVLEAYKLQVKDAKSNTTWDDVEGSDVIKIYKDKTLSGVTYTDQTLHFTYFLADGTTSIVDLPMNSLILETEIAEGLALNDNKQIYVKRDSASEAFLTVGTDGVKLSGVQTAIDTALASGKTYTNEEIAKLDATVSATTHGISATTTEENGKLTSIAFDTTTAGVTVTTDATASSKHKLVADHTDNFVTGSELLKVNEYVNYAVSHLAITAEGTNYVSLTVSTSNNKHVVLATNVQNVTATAGSAGVWEVTDAGVVSATAVQAPTLSGIANSLMDGAQAVEAIKTYIDAKVRDEAKAREKYIDGAVKSLDSTETSTLDVNGNNVEVSLTITDGKITSLSAHIETFDCGEW